MESIQLCKNAWTNIFEESIFLNKSVINMQVTQTVICKQTDPSLSSCEMIYKTEQDALVLLQVTRQKKSVKRAALSAWNMLKKQIEMPEGKLYFIKIGLIPHPEYANDAKLNVDFKKQVSNNKLDRLPPELYQYEF